MKQLLLLASIILFSLYSNAQHKTSISGKIINTEQKGVAGASVEWLKASDSSLVKMLITGNAGEFESTLTPAKYILRISSIGYSDSMLIIAVGETINQLIDPIVLKAFSRVMKEVKVSSKKPFIEQKLDRTVINVESSISSAGATAMEILEKSPGVTVDKDGNVNLKGKSGVLIMLDGKPSYLTGENLANYLRTLPASALEQIEIMTNPPAKYDAAGNSGVINIKTKKNKQKGFNGSANLTYTQGVYWKLSNSVNVNYRNNKWNLFSNINPYRWSGFNDIYVKRNFFKAGTKEIETIYQQDALINMVYPGLEAKMGADFYASKKTTLGIVLTGFTERGIDDNINTSFISSGTGQLNSIIDADATHRQKNRNISINSNFRYQFDSAGRELTMDADYLVYDIQTKQKFNNRFYNANWTKNRLDEIIMGNLPSDLKIYSFKTDYVHPVTKDFKVEAGFKSSLVKSDNDARYTLLVNNAEVIDSGRSNHFVYDENINAGYLNTNRKMGKWSVQVGLRIENTNAKGLQSRNDSSFTRHYTNVFPTMYVGYEVNDKNQFAASFGRRIERPAYQDLNPFRYMLDPYTYQEGNPFLRPQFSYNYELSHSWNGKITTKVNYSHTKDLFTETLNQIDEDTITYVYKQNISQSKNLGLSVSANFHVAKWWSTNLYAEVFQNHFMGEIKNKSLDVSLVSGTFNMNHQLDLGRGWSAEVSGFALTKAIMGQLVIEPLAQLNAGVQKQVLNKKGTLKLNVRDIFATNNFSGKFQFDTIDAIIRQTRDNRTIGLSFSYRFGKNGAPQRERKSGAQEEQNRVKKAGS